METVDADIVGHKFVVELRRYDNPHVTYRFFYYEPETGQEPGTALFYHPFCVGERWDPSRIKGPTYVEAERHQIYADDAQVRRSSLKDQGYQPVAMKDIDEVLRRWVTHSVLPVEWHSILDGKEGERRSAMEERVTLWVKPIEDED